MSRAIDMSKIGRAQPTVKKVLRPVFHALWDFDVSGAENIPVDGPAILCPNHVSVIDSFFVPAVIRRALIYVGKAEYLDDWKTAKLFPALGMIPIDRRGGEHAAGALDAARSVLRSGGLFGIYPEGTRSRSGKLHKGHTGAARLAIETGAPLIPVGLVGTREIQPPDKKFPRVFQPASVKFGNPIRTEQYQGRQGDRALYRQATDELMFEIQALCGQEYVHSYAGATPDEVQPSGDSRSTTEVLKSKPLIGV